MLDPTPTPIPMHHEDGSVSFRTPQGATITTHPDGRVDLNVQHIQNIGIYNIVEVTAHNINHMLGMVSHFVKFRNGGELRFAYNQAGQLIELSFSSLHVNIVDDSKIMFSSTPLPNVAA